MSTTVDKLALGYAKLKLHIAYPALEECWLEGYESAQQQIEEENNPYEYGSTEYYSWADGWWAGFYNEEPIFQAEKLDQSTIEKLNTNEPAANESHFISEKTATWLKRGFQIATLLLIAAAAYEFTDLAA